jgi:hypothetical protein
VKDLLHYRYLTVPLSPEFANAQARELWAKGARLMFVDALTPVASALGHDLSGGNVNGVEACYATVLDPWSMVGFCAVLLDNTGKRDRSEASGSQHKVAAVGGSVLAVVAEKRSSATRSGSSRIFLNKDRSGSVAHEVISAGGEERRLFGTLHVEPTGDDLVSVYVSPPPSAAAAAVTAVATTMDIIAQTCGLAAEALRRNGIAEITSMRRLTDLMGVVRGIDPSLWEAAHTDRERITSCLFKVADADALKAAGIGASARATATSIRYRVWLT